MDLSQIKPRTIAKITKVNGSGGVLRRMLDMGCVKGTVIEVIKVAPLGDPIEIKVKGYNLSLRKNEAKNIEVEEYEGKA